MKLLFIAYYFDPYPGVGAKRVTYWAKHILSLSGKTILPTVITATKQVYKSDLEVIYVKDNDKALFKKIFPQDKGITWINDIKEYFTKYDFDYDAVVITGSPFLHFFLSKFFKTKQAKVILDFRDPYAINPLFKKQNFIKKTIKRYFERQ